MSDPTKTHGKNGIPELPAITAETERAYLDGLFAAAVGNDPIAYSCDDSGHAEDPYTQGYLPEAAFDSSDYHEELYKQGYARAEANIQAGRDPVGHPPNFPGLCARDVRKVCNCNISTRALCVLPAYPPRPANVTWTSIGQALLRKLRGR